MGEASNSMSLFGFAVIGLVCGAIVGLLLVVLGVSEPYPLPDRARDGDALIGYPVVFGAVGAVAGLLFGGVGKLSEKVRNTP